MKSFPKASCKLKSRYEDMNIGLTVNQRTHRELILFVFRIKSERLCMRMRIVQVKGRQKKGDITENLSVISRCHTFGV